MNKKDLNRKIQLLEKYNKELKSQVREITLCECKACAEKRKERMSALRKRWDEWNHLLSLIGTRY